MKNLLLCFSERCFENQVKIFFTILLELCTVWKKGKSYILIDWILVLFLARKTKVDDYSKFVNESSKKANGKLSNGKQKTNHLEVPTNFENAERAISQSSFRDPTSIENVTDWKKVIKKYYALIRYFFKIFVLYCFIISFIFRNT